jgi:HAD superfamily hydrolase (TIGR01662 family)
MSEIVIVMGYNASGKSTLVTEFVQQGYLRLNRDEMGGTLDKQAVHAEKAIDGGHDRVVLDNTYPTVASRESIVAVGRDRGVPVRCVWLTTSFEDASLNACLRMCQKAGKVLCTPADLKADEYKNDPNLFPIAALFRYKKIFEKPTTDEGFSKVETRKFVREWPAPYKNKALILDYDDTLRRSTGPKKWPEDPSHVEILPGRKERLQQAKKDGYLILGASNQSACAKGLPIETAKACFDETNKGLGLDIEYAFCPHGVPPTCYCRKPQVGMGAFFIWKYQLLPSKCIMVGDSTSDKTFAKRCGFQFQTEKEFFGD